MKNYNLYLCSFASPDLEISKKRFINQAKRINFYKGIKVFGIKDLPRSKQIQISKFLKNSNRLYGYGCWKAQIIKIFLRQIPKNSILQYSDIGCHLNPNGLKRLKSYTHICYKKNILTFQYKKPKFKIKKKLIYQKYFEYEYTKKDLANYLGIKNYSNFFKSEQIMSGVIFFKNNKFSLNILNKWEKILSKNHLINDENSKLINHKKFIEHRHDQSAFSLICKKNNVYSLSASECEWAEEKNSRTWEHLKYFPVHAKRDKKYNFLKRFINRQKKNINRIIN